MSFFNKLFALYILIGLPNHLFAATLSEFLPELLANHERMIAARAESTAATNRQRVTQGNWFPQLNLSTSAGKEQQVKVGGGSSDLSFDETKLKITQLLWDFGASNAALKKAAIVSAQAELDLHNTSQNLLLEAITAYANLIRSYQVLGFARRSETNIRAQTGLEQVRIDSGSGLSTDLLQAKTQLAGAQARRVDAEGSRDLAINRFYGLFSFDPPVERQLQGVRINDHSMPESLEQALEVAAHSNWDLLRAELQAAVSEQDVRASRSRGFFPKIEASAERNWKTDVAGIDGFKQETIYKVSINYPFNLGFTANNDLAAARADAVGVVADLSRIRRDIKEQTRNAWQRWQTAKQKVSFLSSQVDISRAFLDLAIEERQLGRRSLIDVLSGETSWINAGSDAVAAHTDIVLAAAELLAVMGKLSTKSVVSETINHEPKRVDEDKQSGDNELNKEGILNDISVNNIEKGLQTRLNASLQGWNNREVATSLGFYINGFSGRERSAKEWRANRLNESESISISAQSTEVFITDDGDWKMEFFQDYQSPKYADRMRKQRPWRLVDGQWQVVVKITLGLG